MMNHLTTIILILFSAGLFGGLINYFRSFDYHKFKREDFLKSLVMGIGAALLIPIIIKLLQLNLLESSQDDPINYLYIFSLGLVVAIFSSDFIDRVGKVFLKRLDNLENEVKETKRDFVNAGTELDSDDSLKAFDFHLEDSYLKILNAMDKSKFVYRALNKIASEVSMDKEDVRNRLWQLEKYNLVEQVERPEGKKWKITNEGKEYIAFQHSQESDTGS